MVNDSTSEQTDRNVELLPPVLFRTNTTQKRYSHGVTTNLSFNYTSTVQSLKSYLFLVSFTHLSYSCVFINRDKYFIEECLKVISLKTVHDEALQRRNYRWRKILSLGINK